MRGSLMRLHETRTASTPNIYVKNPAIPPWAASAVRANTPTHRANWISVRQHQHALSDTSPSARQLQRYKRFCKTKEKRGKNQRLRRFDEKNLLNLLNRAVGTCRDKTTYPFGVI